MSTILASPDKINSIWLGDNMTAAPVSSTPFQAACNSRRKSVLLKPPTQVGPGNSFNAPLIQPNFMVGAVLPILHQRPSCSGRRCG